MPSLTETHLCDRFTAWKQGFYLGVEDKNECMSSSAIQTPVFTPNRASHTDPQTAAGGDNPAACGGGQIQFLTYPLIIRFTLFSSGLHINAATSPPRLPGGHGQGRHGGEGCGQEKGLTEDEVRRAFRPGDTRVPLDRADAFLVFSCRADKWLIVSTNKGTVFPAMGIRGRRKSLRHRVGLRRWMQKAVIISAVLKSKASYLSWSYTHG